jgi:hypothetical protein
MCLISIMPLREWNLICVSIECHISAEGLFNLLSTYVAGFRSDKLLAGNMLSQGFKW